MPLEKCGALLKVKSYKENLPCNVGGKGTLVYEESTLICGQNMEELCMTYLNEFKALKCANDILTVLSPIPKMEKEISEAMTILNALIRTVGSLGIELHNIYDLCAGNGLAGVLITHMYKRANVTAVDIHKRVREWEKIDRFQYLEADIAILKHRDVSGGILISSHPCANAKYLVQMFRQLNPKALIMIPCCSGKVKYDIPQAVQDKLGDYASWCFSLYQESKIFAETESLEKIKLCMYYAKKCVSPRNIVITAIRE